MAGNVVITAQKFANHAEFARAVLEEQGHTLIDRTRQRPMDEAALLALAADADALIAGPEPVSARVLAAAPRLRIVNAPGVGYDHIDIEEAARRGVAVCICAGSNHYAVAELTLGWMLALARRIPQMDRAVRAGQWPSITGPELRSKTLGIVGLGHIGKALALMTRGLGMRVLATDTFRDITFASEHQIDYVPLGRLLREADFVSLHCPVTPQTRGMINDATLARMKPTAYLLNTARGPLVDEPALADALRAGRIAGAALDVFATEPPGDNPFVGLDNVILGSHRGGATAEAIDRSAEVALENVTRALRGERPLYRVN